MPAPEFPADLLALQRAFDAADQAVHAHVAAVEAQHTGLWSDAEAAKLDRLRDERMAALRALWAHPEHKTIQAAGQWPALKKAARRSADG